MNKSLYYVHASWCQPCQQFGPVMDQVSKKYHVVKIDADYEPDVQRKFNVKSVPTVILVQNEQEIKRFVGTKSYEQVIEWIEN